MNPAILLAAATVVAPVPNMTTDWWSNNYDTPEQGLAPGEVSLIVAEITVSKRGHFAGCTGKAYLGNPQMGPYVCSRLKLRARFEPARGPDGERIVGVYRKMITVANIETDFTDRRKTYGFRAPAFGIGIPASVGGSSDSPFEIQFYLAADGQVRDCSLIESVGINLERHKQSVEPAAVERACAEIPAQLKPVPLRDKGGNAIPSVQNALVIVGGAAKAHN